MPIGVTNEAKNSAENEQYENNVLVISQVRNKVILPYTTEALQKESDEGKTGCESMRELIDKKYTVSLSRYKLQCIARFKEAYRLIRIREKGSVFDALGLATELFFVRLLHPAIITACKSLDWLDIYLDCLDKNELEDFPFFRIEYELKPKKSKRKSYRKSNDTTK